MAASHVVPAPARGGIVSAPAPGEQAEQTSTFRWVGVLGLSLLPLALRAFAIEHDSLWLDEAITRLCIRIPIIDLITGRVVLDIGDPPLYLVLGSWKTTSCWPLMGPC
jgi:hypothetical protein